MRKTVFFLLFLLFFCFGCSESTEDKSDADETKDESIVEIPDEEIEEEADEEFDDTDDEQTEKFKFDIQRVYDDVAWLAHDDRAGRLPGTAGNDEAVEYVRKLFEELDLLPVADDDTFLQVFDFDMWNVEGEPQVALEGDILDPNSDFRIFQYSGSGNVNAEIVFAGHGMTVPPFDPDEYPDCILPAEGYDDFADIDLDGKIALVIRRGPKGLVSIHNNCPANDACVGTPCLWNFGYKAKNAALNGAAGVIVINSYHESGAAPAGMTLGEEYYTDDLPAVFISTEKMEKVIPDIKQWSESIDDTLTPQSVATSVNATISVEARVENIVSPNVIGVLPGTDPELADEIIVIGAHIDHLGTNSVTGEIYNGADDNASGTAVMMELARAFVLGEHEPARTIVFAAWNAEELGLIGSCYYVENPLFPISKTIAAYSIDMVGAGVGYGLAMHGATLSDNAWLADVMSGYAEEIELGFEVVPSSPLDASDHVCFYYSGVPAVLLSTLGMREYYHTPQDTIDTILIEDMEAAVWLSWAGIYPISMGWEDRYIGSEITYPLFQSTMDFPFPAYRKRNR